MEDFMIPYKGLGLGSHSFEFEIDDKFFEGFEYFESEQGQLKVKLELVKESSLMDLHFTIDGRLELVCDRCLGEYSYPVNGAFRLVVKYGEAFLEESEEVVVLPITQSRLDVSRYIFEYINMLLPMKKEHAEEADCDPEMIDKLNTYSKQEHDPRWDALKNIEFKK